MDLKKETARHAFPLVKQNSRVGLGDGATIRFLADLIMEAIKTGLQINLYTSSVQTNTHLQAAGLNAMDISTTDYLDQYFDGCDQVDHALNAFKSGAGIHTSEKIFASMAKQFIILAEESKFVSHLENKFPLVIEVIPEAVGYVSKEMKSIFQKVSMQMRMASTNHPTQTRYGNYLIDCRFTELPELEQLQFKTKNMTGVIETSLFYQIATDAIIVNESGMTHYRKQLAG